MLQTMGGIYLFEFGGSCYKKILNKILLNEKIRFRIDLIKDINYRFFLFVLITLMIFKLSEIKYYIN